MAPSNRHFVSLQSIYNRICKAFPLLTSQQFRGWHGRRKLIDAGAVIHGRVTSKTDNFMKYASSVVHHEACYHQGSFKAFPTNICCGVVSWKWIMLSSAIRWHLLLLILDTLLLPWLVSPPRLLFLVACVFIPPLLLPWIVAHSCFARMLLIENDTAPLISSLLLFLWPWPKLSSDCNCLSGYSVLGRDSMTAVHTISLLLLPWLWWVTHISLAATLLFVCMRVPLVVSLDFPSFWFFFLCIWLLLSCCRPWFPSFCCPCAQVSFLLVPLPVPIVVSLSNVSDCSRHSSSSRPNCMRVFYCPCEHASSWCGPRSSFFFSLSYFLGCYVSLLLSCCCPFSS